MKPLLVLARITFVGCLWSIIFIEGVRVIMLENWRFDIFWPLHWLHAWNLWLSGWVIDTPKEWAFVLIIAAFIPLWLTGWIAISLVPWEMFVWRIIMLPINFIRSFFNPLKIVVKTPVVVKKKSYKEIRPAGKRTPIYDYNDNTVPQTSSSGVSAIAAQPAVSASPSASTNQSIKDKAVTSRETFSHALFNLDDEDDDFDLDFDSFEKSDIFKTGKKEKESVSVDKDSVSSSRDRREKFDLDDNEKPRRRDNRNDRSDRYSDDDYTRRKNYDDDYVEKNRGRRQDQDRHQDQDYRDDDRDYKRNSRRNDSKYNDNRRDDNKYNDNRRSDFKKDDKKRDDRKTNYDGADDRRNNRDKNDNRNKNGTDSVIRGANPVADILSQKGFQIISGITVRNTIIDFVGVAEDKICLCLIDKEPGDWLADEERFNDEEPLWFSESSHRISPVRKVDLARQVLQAKLENNGFDFDVKPYVIVQMGNIINAEDMFEIWNELGVEVTRINRGSPKEIRLFSKTIEEADGHLDKSQLESIKKLIRSIN